MNMKAVHKYCSSSAKKYFSCIISRFILSNNHFQLGPDIIWLINNQWYQIWAHFLSFAGSKLRLCSANHRPGYWSNPPCDWPTVGPGLQDRQASSFKESIDLAANHKRSARKLPQPLPFPWPVTSDPWGRAGGSISKLEHPDDVWLELKAATPNISTYSKTYITDARKNIMDSKIDKCYGIDDLA